MKIKVGFIDSDINYLNRISIILLNKYGKELILYSFSDSEIARKQIQQEGLDVLLVNEKIPFSPEHLPESCEFAYLVDSPQTKQLNQKQAVCKYQSAEGLYQDIRSLYLEKAELRKDYVGEAKEDLLYAFFSVHGGAGASSVAAAYAIRQAQEGKHVLYLNLEDYGDSSFYFHGEGKESFNNVIFAVKTAIKEPKNNFTMKFARMIRNDAASKVNYVASCENALHLSELTEEEWDWLLQRFKEQGEYDRIVLDVGGDFFVRGKTILKKADRAIFVASGTVAAQRKLNRLAQILAVWKEQDKGRARWELFENKSGKTNSVPLEELLPIAGKAPRIEGCTREEDLVCRLAELLQLEA